MRLKRILFKSYNNAGDLYYKILVNPRHGRDM